MVTLMNAPDTQHTTKKVLLIDEDCNFRRVLRYFLSEMGLEVDEADGGRSAVEICLSGDYAIIVADASTPIMGILCFLIDIKKRRPKLPVVLVSAFSAQENRVEAYCSGAIEFVEKPFDPALFKETIGRLINQPARRPSSTSVRR
jgi:DNA-binding NtrC family response regulator